jgi:hypothetical protein
MANPTSPFGFGSQGTSSISNCTSTNHNAATQTDPTTPTPHDNRFQNSLNSTLLEIIAFLPDTAIPANIDPVPRLIAILEHFESSHDNNGETILTMTDNRQMLLRAISCLRTINLYFSKDRGKRKPRTGEVGDALDLLRRMLRGLGLQGEFLGSLRSLAEEVRRY